ncbi:alpha-ketoacid dehydrogenase subunit beta [Hydrogenophaga luteola]|uniref:Alpha-ketoacid dehydrogenase subunit beta n=1 Tax=Hydrogenophaga luteola TaxID=1591122 RepID=A0ABV7W296_9BURK
MTERKLTMAAAISEAIAEAMAADERVFVMGEDVGRYGGIFGATSGLFDRFGADRVRDTPISETAFIGAALGAAAEGQRPIVELMFADFFGVCFDQIYNHLAKNHYMSGGQVKLPVVLTTAIGGGYNDAAQHSQCLYASFGHVPGLKVVVPSNAYDAKGLMAQAIADDNPVVFMFHKGLMGLPWMSYFEGATVAVPETPYRIPLGRARTVRQGRDLSLVTISQMVHKAEIAAARLADEGIDVEVIDLRTVVPLDREAVIASVARTGRLLVADEDYRSHGLSGEVMAVVGEALGRVKLRAPMRRVAVPDVPIPYSRVLEQAVIPQVADLVAAARAVLAADFERQYAHG